MSEPKQMLDFEEDALAKMASETLKSTNKNVYDPELDLTLSPSQKQNYIPEEISQQSYSTGGKKIYNPDKTGLSVKVKDDVEKDYPRLIAAQNESRRRIEIECINKSISETKKRRVRSAVLSGLCIAGLGVATMHANVDTYQILQTEIKAFGSFAELKNYLSSITPAMYLSILGAAASFSNYLRAGREQTRLTGRLESMMANKPEDLQEEVKRQAMGK